MKAYVVIQAGVYRHDIAGVTQNLPDAIVMANNALDGERDDHHHYDIVEVDIGVLSQPDQLGAPTDNVVMEVSQKAPAEKWRERGKGPKVYDDKRFPNVAHE